MGCVWSKSHRICDLEEDDVVQTGESGSNGVDHTLGKRSKKKQSNNNKSNVSKFKSFNRNFRHRAVKTKKSNSISSNGVRHNDDNENPKPVIQFQPKPDSQTPWQLSQQQTCPFPQNPALDPPVPTSDELQCPSSPRTIFSSTAIQLKIEEFVNPIPSIDSKLSLGTISETWKNRAEWMKFKAYLDGLDEGQDSMDRPMSLGRYGLFLELLVELDQADRVHQRSNEDMRSLVMRIRYHPEDFFGMERCLSGIEMGMRHKVLANCKEVEQSGTLRGGMWVFEPVYQRVLDELDMFLGNYNKTLVRQSSG
ncbi:hypothetical protein TCAL_04098 [Tigriopus californicus]|uniref:Uncharacterized protein n=1 Tax=Tigriopus californicus TaxID=6832 RepID=A0A553NU95_TIGCA|nr:uncharacterized protein LOC131893597 [Tigriopus californicus]TRY69001.1 hypothetical protein TCAL_04098 [Tigriopus californicus]|eukprot:TCALIF_04098-PA protein Name:"Protein of unknown function" AED:0.94 eAED:0.94 QI:0/0/0/0.5/1/1/2/0/307